MNSGMNIGPPDEDGEDTKMISDRIICTIHHALKQAKEKEEHEEVDKKKGTHILPLPIRTITWSYITYIMECNNGYREIYTPPITTRVQKENNMDTLVSLLSPLLWRLLMDCK